MPGVGTRVLEKSLAHLSGTLERAEHLRALHIDARVKVVSALLLTVAAVSSRRLDVVIFLFVMLTVAALIANITWRRLIAAWAGGLFFAALVAVPAIFTAGWKTSLLLVSRSEVSLTCWLLVVLTTPFNRVLRALRALHVPVVFVAILSMTFRYIFLLIQTAQDMLLSRRSRIVGRLSGAVNRKLLISTSGVLLSKSIQMSDDVYQAMTSRGFRGDIHVLEDFEMTRADWMILWTLAAVSILALWVGR
jgi:energy-coupling factor transporter transmembrane protein EcfT